MNCVQHMDPCHRQATFLIRKQNHVRNVLQLKFTILEDQRNIYGSIVGDCGKNTPTKIAQFTTRENLP